MTHPANRRLACVLMVVAALVPSAALGTPAEDTTRIALLGGWRYQPNARFGELAGAAGYPLSGPSAGGPSLLGIFAYRPLAEVEVALELGWAYERWRFEGGGELTLNQMPITLAVRWSPLQSWIYPYIGAGYGYLLNFFAGENSPPESHGSGPTLLAGAALELSERFSVVVEYRYTHCRAKLGELGALQAGANSFMFGLQLAFPPEDRRLK